MHPSPGPAKRPGKIFRIASRIPVYARDLRANPRWGLMFVFGRFIALRRLVAGSPTPIAPADQSAMSPSIDLASPLSTMTAALREQGLARGLNLHRDVVDAIVRFADAEACYANFDRSKPFLAGNHEPAEQSYGCAIVVGHFLEKILDCSEIHALTGDPVLWSIARSYLGERAKLVATRMWWSFASSRSTAADKSLASQAFHYDLDDWRQLKCFFYLSDVDETRGPHAYIRGSHRNKPFGFQFSPFVGKDEDLLLRNYGEDAICTITGAAGTGFAEDPFGYHIGRPLTGERRLILELSFGTADVLGRRRFGALTDDREPETVG